MGGGGAIINTSLVYTIISVEMVSSQAHKATNNSGKPKISFSLSKQIKILVGCLSK